MEDDIIRMLREDILDHDEAITADTELFDIGLDSMAIMQLQLALEDEFGVAIDPADLSRDNFRTAASIASLVRAKRSS